MRLHQKMLMAVAIGGLLASCNANYKKTKEGMRYKIINDGKGDNIKHGQFLKVNFTSKVGDSLLMSTFDRIPGYGMYDTSIHGVYDFIDILGEMKVGDSAVYSRSVDTLVKKGMLQYAGKFKKGGTIDGYIKIVAAFPTQEALMADQQKEIELEKNREVAGLEKYLKEKGITNAKKTANGVFVVVDSEGTGAKADTGTTVKVKYTGFLKSGSKFDSNVDSSFMHTEPFSFAVGAQQVIPGWDEGIRLLKAGGKAKMFIPAMLAYGQQSQGEKMPAYSDLIFDIEVLEVTPTPAASAPVQAPHSTH